MKNLAPIALFVYNRLSHTQKTVSALQLNRLAKESDLFIFSDGPKDENGKAQVEALREYLKTIQGFKSITIREQEKNKGLARSIIDGVTEIVYKHGKVIVLEDDLVTSVAFLEYMNFCLDHFEHDERVYSINAYMFRIQNLPKYFFLKGGDCWGWATWARAWKDFNPDASYLYKQLTDKNLIDDWNYGGPKGGMRGIIEYAIKNPRNVWHICWTTSIYLQNKLGVWPARSYVQNIGMDGGGTNTKEVKLNDYPFLELDTEVDRDFIQHMKVEETPTTKAIVLDFYQKGKTFIRKMTVARIIDTVRVFTKKILKIK